MVINPSAKWRLIIQNTVKNVKIAIAEYEFYINSSIVEYEFYILEVCRTERRCGVFVEFVICRQEQSGVD